MISASFEYLKQRATVLGAEMAFVDEGDGDPIVFVHGNPTYSYIWRNILPYARPFGRIIAPDLVGMGDSQKLSGGPDAYSFVEHRRFLDALLEALDVRGRVTLVGHDWGAALSFDWAYRHPEAVKGLAYMEAVLRPTTSSEASPVARERFQALRSPAGVQMVLEQNSFIEFNLPRTILRTLTAEEMDAYRRPFREPGEGRRPMLSWARQLPIDGQPADVTAILTAVGDWLLGSAIPKLFIRAEPGVASPAAVEAMRSWPAQSEVVVRGHHTPQEDSPDEIGQALAAWLPGLPAQPPAEAPAVGRG